MSIMYNTIIIYVIISFSLFLLGSLFSYKLNLLDKPGKRKIHLKPTAYTGGLILSLIFLISLQLFKNLYFDLNLIISVSLIMAIIGFADDRYNMSYSNKLTLQIFVVFYLIFIKNISLNDIGNYEYFKLGLYSFSETFTLFCVLLLINAFNYFDGIDGSLTITTISVLPILYFIIPDDTIRLFLIIIFVPLFIFLFFNFSVFNLPKLFLGDSGSLLLGFIISFLIIYSASNNITHPILLAWSISIFVYEFLSTNLERIIQRKNVFKAGLDHLHYGLLKKTKSPLLSSILIFTINIFFFLIGFVTFHFSHPLTSLLIFVSMFFIYYYFRKRYFFQ